MELKRDALTYQKRDSQDLDHLSRILRLNPQNLVQTHFDPRSFFSTKRSLYFLSSRLTGHYPSSIYAEMRSLISSYTTLRGK